MIGGAAAAASHKVPDTTDRATGRLISPIVAAALCVKPPGLLSDNQAAKVDAVEPTKSQNMIVSWRRSAASCFGGSTAVT
jgi:hypothetical protein